MPKRKAHEPAQVSSPEPPLTAPLGGASVRPLVFISHDSRDAELAEAFTNLLTDASGGTLKSFRSSDRKGTSGIEFGAEWYKTIMDNINSATDVVALLTPNSINRPWILYEVGVAKGTLNTTALGLALGVPLDKASSGPFAQFQNSADDEDSLTKLVLQLIRRIPDASPREEAVRRQVQAFRQSIEKFAKQASKPTHGSNDRVDETVVAKLFEEVKVLFRDLPGQVEGKLQANLQPRRPRRRRLLSTGAEEFFFNARLLDMPSGDALGWLVFISLIKDDFPWFYEAGLEVYRALRAAESRKAIKHLQDLAIMISFVHRSPLGDMLLDGESFLETRRSIEVLERVVMIMRDRIEQKTARRIKQAADTPENK